MDILNQILQIRKVPQWYYKKMLDKSCKNQKDLAVALCNLAGVSPDEAASLADIQSSEEALNVGIAVISSRLGNKFMRVPDTNRPVKRPNQYLYLVALPDQNMGHFHAITSMFFEHELFLRVLYESF